VAVADLSLAVVAVVGPVVAVAEEAEVVFL